MNCDLTDLKQETISCNGENLENFFSSIRWATWLPIVPYCVEWATARLSIVGSPLEASDKSHFNIDWIFE